MTSILPNITDSATVFRRLADNFPGFCWIVSLSQEQPRLQYVSTPASPLWKWCRQKILEDFQNLSHLLHPEDVGKLAAAWDRLRQGDQVAGECRLLGPRGEVHQIAIKAFPLDPENSPPLLLAGFCLDHATCLIRRQAEDALAREASVNAALAEVSRAVINSAPPEDLSRLVLAKTTYMNFILPK